jgi:hypothetical protein
VGAHPPLTDRLLIPDASQLLIRGKNVFMFTNME